jgi:hypothetical protein
MYDYEGSRSEFLKLLAECGEEPAFIARAQAPLSALEALLSVCEAKRQELLEWPRLHLAALAHQIRNDWSGLRPWLAIPEAVNILEKLHADMPSSQPAKTEWFVSDKAALHRFLESAERFNRHWREFIERVDLEGVNKPRRDYNQFYVLEKACAFGNERVTDGFEPLEMIDGVYLYERFPILILPSLM